MRVTLVLLYLLLSTCVSIPDPVEADEPPSWSGALYVGDPKQNAVVRAQAKESISCSDERFGEMICMRFADFKDLAIELKYLRSMKCKREK